MKQIVLFALWLAAAATMSAQTITSRTDRQSGPRRPAGQAVRMAPKAVDIHRTEASGRKMVCDETQAPARRAASAPQPLDTYHVSATEVMGNADRTRSKVAWDMTVSDNGDGTYTFHDFLPVPDLFKDLAASVSVTGRRVGNQIVIDPTKTTMRKSIYQIWIGNNRGDANGIIKIDIDESGGLKLEAGTVLTYFGVEYGEDFVLSGDNKTVLGFFFNYEDVRYATDVRAQFAPKGIILNSTMDYMGNARNRNGGIMPPYVPVAFENTSLNAESYEWHVDEVILNFYTGLYDYVMNTFEGTGTDFSFTPGGNFATYTPVRLTANGKGSSTYTFGNQYGGTDGTRFKETVYVAGDLSDRFALETGETPILSIMNPDLGFATLADFATPGIAKQAIADLIMYQGRPEAPLYCEGVNILLHNYERYGTLRLTCGLYRARRESNGFVTLGEKIAESKKTTEFTSGAYGNTITELRFTGFTLFKADGTSRVVDHLFIEDEFAIVLSGWDSRTFSAVPFGELNQEEGSQAYTFFRIPGDERIYRFDSANQKLCAGFYYSGYGHLKSSADTDIVELPAEGGGAMVLIDPLFGNSDGSARIFRDYEEYPIPEWLDMGIVPLDEGEGTGNEVGDDDSFLLAFIADPLPEGIDSRSAEMELWQEGAKIHFTIRQTRHEDGIAAPASPNAATPAYNLSGQRVDNRHRGLIIQNGKVRKN